MALRTASLDCENVLLLQHFDFFAEQQDGEHQALSFHIHLRLCHVYPTFQTGIRISYPLTDYQSF
jgi:hypothetical protein